MWTVCVFVCVCVCCVCVVCVLCCVLFVCVLCVCACAHVYVCGGVYLHLCVWMLFVLQVHVHVYDLVL